MPDVIHEPERQRFVMKIDGAEAVLEYRAAGPGVLEYYRTFVPRELRGRGLASVLAEHALAHARDGGFKVIPSCSFVADFIARNPDHRATS